MNYKNGFTLVEVIATIAIVAILALIALPNFLNIYNTSNNNALKVQENEMVDAAKLVLENYCVHPLGGNSCSMQSKEVKPGDSSSTLRYTCLDGMQSSGYIGKIIYKNQECNGFVLYEKDPNSKNYLNHKAYIECGKNYQTQGYDTFKDSSNNYLIENCHGHIIDTSSPGTPNTPTPSSGGVLMAGAYEGASASYLRTNIEKQDIEKITFTNNLSGHSYNGTTCFDVSKNEDRSVLAWVTDTDNNGFYEMTIGANGGVVASTGDYQFFGLYNLHTIDGLQFYNTSNVTSMKGMFAACAALTNIDLSNLNTSNVTDMSYMFANDSGSYPNDKMTSLNPSHLNTNKVKDMTKMFYGLSTLTSINLSNINTSNVESMSEMFGGCTSLTSIDLSGFDTKNVKDMSGMFYKCNSLTNITFGSNFKTNKVTAMFEMFRDCFSLISIDFTGWDTSNVNNMASMFAGCKALSSLILTGFNTSSVTNMSAMFSNCSNLIKINLTSFDTSNVTNMSDMFSNCSGAIQINMSNFNTTKVQNMTGMFSDCKSLASLDISKFVTSAVTNMSYMFSNCTNLKTIYANEGFVTSNVTNSANMFKYSTKLVGGNGTTYAVGYIDKTRAKVDNGSSSPGYFTYKSRN